MSAQEVKSEDLTYEVDGSAQTFRTITTFENSKITNTKIQQVIDVDLYNQRVADGDSSLVTADDNGLYYQTIRDKKADTKYADIDIRREFAKTGPNSFTNQLQNAQIDALKAEFTEDQEGSKDYFWRNQLSGNDNVARNPEPEPTEIATNYAIEELEIEGVRKTKYENLFYPEDITTSKQDRIRFTMFFRSGSRIGFNLEDKNPFVIGKKSITNIEGSVTLPIQGGIEDRNEVSYNNSKLDPVRGALAAVSLNPQAALQNLINVLQGNAEDIQAAFRSTEAKNTIGALRLFLAQSAVGAQGLIPRTTGAILNPNLELILNSPSLRSFNYTFKMSARDPEEATQIRKIIRFFKQGMSVKRSEQSLFIVSPNMFRIQYLAGGAGNISKDHPSIGKIKDCALTAINTKYTPDGTYMTFDDEARSMTSYEINMQFTELEPLTETDYIETAAREDSIGY